MAIQSQFCCRILMAVKVGCSKPCNDHLLQNAQLAISREELKNPGSFYSAFCLRLPIGTEENFALQPPLKMSEGLAENNVAGLGKVLAALAMFCRSTMTLLD